MRQRIKPLSVNPEPDIAKLYVFSRMVHGRTEQVAFMRFADGSAGVLKLAGKVLGEEAGMFITEGLVTIYALIAIWLICRLRSNRFESLNADGVGPMGEKNGPILSPKAC